MTGERSFENKLRQAAVVVKRIAFEKFSKFPDCLVDVKSFEREVCLDRLDEDPKAQTDTAEIIDYLRKVILCIKCRPRTIFFPSYCHENSK
jgi:hypothetical protein